MIVLSLSKLFTDFAAIGAWGTAVVGLLQIRNERHLRRTAARVHQASKISGWLIDAGSVPAKGSLNNASDTPVFEVVVSLMAVQGRTLASRQNMPLLPRPFRAYLSVLPPGCFLITLPSSGRAPGIQFELEVAFTDAVGHFWARRGNGALEELPVTPIELYRIPSPIDWDYPTTPCWSVPLWESPNPDFEGSGSPSLS